ncbi:DNA primase [Longispora sp. K20-0274]|uniref:DNA primase n=1 Tax=Longispora sp. K20-0274 TaxID=3088255 RepID=UPI00399A7A0D
MSDELPEAVEEEASDDEAAETDELVTRVDDDEPVARRKIVRGEEKAEAEADAEDDDDDLDEPDPKDFEDEPEDSDDEPAEPVVEEVPLFLARRGKLLLFRTVEGLAAFVGSDAPHDLAGLEEWDTVAAKLTVEQLVPTEDDTYELDLVVENLRGGHDAWDPDLLISAGELTRDLAYALRLESVQTSISTGSPLDDLDESLRKSVEGGIGGFLAKRRTKKIGAEQAALAWRTIIGKISAATDWRD